ITTVSPIKDNTSDEIIFYLCIDYPSDVFYKTAIARAVELSTIVATMLLLIISFISILLKSNKVKHSQERFRILSLLTFEGILIHKNGFAVDFNDSLCRILNAKREDLLDNYMFDYIHQDDRHIARVNMTIQYSKPYTLRMVKKTGEPFVAEIEGKDILTEGETLRMIALRDVTERYDENQKLIESYQRYDELSRQSQTFTWEVDANGLYTDVSDAAFEVTGYTPDELIGKRYFYDLSPEPEMLKAQVALMFVEQKPIIELDNIIVKKNGEKNWVSTNALPIISKNHMLKGYKGSDRNINEKKELQKQIENERERLKTTLISVGDGVIATDTEGKITLINKVAEQITGWSEEEAIGENFEQIFNIISEKTRKRLPNPIKLVLKRGKIIELANHTLLITKNNEEVPI
ncbi:bifunctional diguanylate cyclase/phosphodiesterase, partial [bacterium]|nr:bifunctional diguanylate cyclase/phosphodiesterase [bacterium]